MQSLTNKINEIELINRTQCPDFLCLTEHWLPRGVLPDYKVAACFGRTTYKHGGVLIYHKEGLLVSELKCFFAG